MAARKSKAPAKKESSPKKERGRPRLYESAEEFAAKTDEYFESEKGKAFPTMSGLSLHLGFWDRDSFAGYAKYGEEFSRTINKAKLRIEDNRHRLLIAKDTFTPGVIFDLKNNHGWVDKQEVQHSGSVSVMERISRARSRRSS